MKNYLIAIIAIIGFAALIQGASAQGAQINVSCPAVSAVMTEISTDCNIMEPGVQICPNIPQCHNVTKCDAISIMPECNEEGAVHDCEFIPDPMNPNVGIDVGLKHGTHCLDSSHHPVLCTFISTECPTESCDYNETGQWVGESEGGWAYQQADGYKMGLREVTVKINVTAIGGIDHICKNGEHGAGVVKMTVDNYDIQKGLSPRQAMVLNDPVECDTNPQIENAVWTGKFYMHYWEKPGMYTVHAEAISCCGKTATVEKVFDYIEIPSICLAPEGRKITYPNAVACGNNVNATALGDVETSTCLQCDIGSDPATIRNIGNSVVNLLVMADDMTCRTPATCNFEKIPVSKLDSTGMKQQGKIWIQLGINKPWHELWNTYQNETFIAQAYCNTTIPDPAKPCCANITVPLEGLPPGPHATNVFDMMIKPLPCISPGTYGQTISISTTSVQKCCQDHREPAYPETIPGPHNNCITPPQAYEVPGRYAFGTLTQDS